MNASTAARSDAESAPDRRSSRSWFVRIITATLAALGWLAILCIAAWLVGRVLTDRFEWSQWLWWIPTPAMGPVLILGFISALRPARNKRVRRNRLLRWTLCAAALIAYFSIIEHRLLHGVRAIRPTASPLKLVHWNVEPAIWAHVEPSLEQIIKLDGDITVLTNPGAMLQLEAAQEWIARGREVHYSHPFAVITRTPLRSLTTLISTDRMHVVEAVFETQGPQSRPLVVYMVDFPSNPRIWRMGVMQRARTMLDGLRKTPPDVVVGDFNTPRGSASIDALFPNMSNAFNEAGHGYGATFRREFPLYHIDQILLGPNVQA